MNAEIDDANATIRARLDNERRAREDAVAREAYAGIVRPADEARMEQESADLLGQWARGEIRSFDVDLGQVAAEKRAIRAGLRGQELRVATVGTATAGGNTVPTDFVRSLYDYLEVFSGMRRTNATILTTASGNTLDMPKVTSHGTAAVVGEGTALAAADPAFGKLTLGSWKYGQLLQVSNELLTDTAVDLNSFLAKDAGRAIARATDGHYVTGNGTNQPLGVMTACGTGVTGGTGLGGSATMNDLISLLYSVNEEYRMNGAQWLMADATAGSVRTLKSTNGDYYWQPSTQLGQPDRLLNHEVISDPNVAALGTGAKYVGYGDFSTYIIRDVSTVRFERSDDYAFDKDLVTYRCIFRTDGDLLDLTGSIKAFRGGTA
jgi:HK97 family phage major capsid protein